MTAKSNRLLQIFVLLLLLCGPLGMSQPVQASNLLASQPHVQIIDRNLNPFRNYSIQVQPQRGEAYYILTREDLIEDQPTISHTVSPASISIGGMAIVTVRLENMPAEGYTSIELTCGYYPDVVEVSNVVVDDLFGVDPVVAISSPSDGIFIVAIAGSDGQKATSDGTVIAFVVRGLQAGQSPLECEGRVSTGDNTLTQITSIGNNVTVLENTPTPGTAPTLCDRVQFMADITIPDGTPLAPGVSFTKTWRLKNIGSCVWTRSYQLAFFSGEQMGGPSSANFPVNVAPGQTVDISVSLIAPTMEGRYRGYWMFKNDNGALFGQGVQANKPWWVDIRVTSSSGTPAAPTNGPTESNTPGSPTLTPAAPTASVTPSLTPGGPTVTPIPNVVYDFATNACEAAWSSEAGSLPCPGIDGDPRGFVLRIDQPRLETGAMDPRRGLLTFPQNIQNGTIIGRYPPIRIQTGDRFRSILTCEFGATSCYVAFRLDYQIGSDPFKTFWGPYLERYEGRHYLADIDLSPLAGNDVRFILTTLSAGIATGDRALWVGPIIARGSGISTSTSEASPVPTASQTVTPGEPPPLTFTSTPSIGSSTPTSMLTGTPMPFGTLNGTVLASKLVRIEAYNAEHILVGAAWVNPDGSFAFDAASGTNSVVAMASGCLSAQRSVTVTDGSTITLPTLSLIAGDIDGNNVIDQFDALTIGMNYNQAVPYDADLNNDGIINVLDLELLAKNYRRTGPVPWQ